MRFRLRQTTRTAAGRDITREQLIEQSTISIGRAAERDVVLADLAVSPDHATLAMLDDRRLRARASGSLGFDVDGRRVREAVIDTAAGAELRFGGHRLTVSRERDDVVLLVERVETLSQAARDIDPDRAFSLRRLLPGKRGSAWLLVALVLALFVAVPLWRHAATGRATPASGATLALRAEQSWSSGPLSQAHHGLETRCEACHVKGFVSVRDDSCRACHKDVHDHAAQARLVAARAPPGPGGRFLRAVANGFGKEAPGACTDCHSEHEGAGPMRATPQAFCTDCHAGLNTRLPDTRLGDAADFGRRHPQFAPVVTTRPGARPVLARRSLDRHPVERTGLKFPHALHLAASGGVARMVRTLPARYGDARALACADCHRPSADGVRFLPVEMTRDCAGCHALGFETIGGTVRTLRHGAPDQVIADLRAYYRSTGPARPIDLGAAARRRPGDFAQARVASVFGAARTARPARAEEAIRAVFSPGGACHDCHSVQPPAATGAGWRVVPVHQPLRYLFHGWFDHAAHRTQRCESCHAARASRAASDLLLPGIKTCRACHANDSAAKAPGDCALCHRYHLSPGAPWRAERAAQWRDDAIAAVAAAGH